MGILRLAGQTAVMILTGKVVSEGIDAGKKKYKRYKEFAKSDEDNAKDATVEQVEG